MTLPVLHAVLVVHPNVESASVTLLLLNNNNLLTCVLHIRLILFFCCCCVWGFLGGIHMNMLVRVPHIP